MLPAEQKRFRPAVEQKDYGLPPIIVGEGADLTHDVPPAGSIVDRVISEAVALLLGAYRMLAE